MPPDDPSGARPTPVVLRIKLRYDDVEAMIQRFAPNVGKTGLFLPTKSLQPVGTEIKFELRLSNDQPVLVGLGRVKAAHEPDPQNPRATFGIAVELMRVTRESRDLILRMLERRKALGLPDTGLPMPADIDAARRADFIDTGVKDAHSGAVPHLIPATDSAPAAVSEPLPFTAPRRQTGPIAVAKLAVVEPLAPEPLRKKRPPIADLIASVASGPILASFTTDALDEDVDVSAVLARARTLAMGKGNDLDNELDAILEASAAPIAIDIEVASAELARQLGGAAVRRDRSGRSHGGNGGSARWAPPPPTAEQSSSSGEVNIEPPAVSNPAGDATTGDAVAGDTAAGDATAGDTAAGDAAAITATPAHAADGDAAPATVEARSPQRATRSRGRARGAHGDAAPGDAATFDAVPVGVARVDAGPVGSATVEAPSVDAASVDAASVGAATVDAARVGAAAVEPLADKSADNQVARDLREASPRSSVEAPDDKSADDQAARDLREASARARGARAARADLAARDAARGSSAGDLARGSAARDAARDSAARDAARGSFARDVAAARVDDNDELDEPTPIASIEPLFAPQDDGLPARRSSANLIHDEADVAAFEDGGGAEERAHEVEPDQIHDEIHRLDESDFEEVEHTQVGEQPAAVDPLAFDQHAYATLPAIAEQPGLADRLDQHLDAAEREDMGLGFGEESAGYGAAAYDPAAYNRAAYGDSPVTGVEDEDIEEIDDFEILAEADANDADLLGSAAEQEVSGGYATASQGGSETFAPGTFAPETFAPETFAAETLEPETFAPETLAPETLAPESLPPDTFAPGRFAPGKFAPGRFAPGRLARAPVAESLRPDSDPPESLASESLPPEALGADTFAFTPNPDDDPDHDLQPSADDHGFELPAVRPSFLSRLELDDDSGYHAPLAASHFDEFSHERDEPDPRVLSAGHALRGFEDSDHGVRSRSYGSEYGERSESDEIADFSSPGSYNPARADSVGEQSYTFAEGLTGGDAEEFDAPHGDYAAQPNSGGFVPPDAFDQSDVISIRADVSASKPHKQLRQAALDEEGLPDLESALEALDVDLDDLGGRADARRPSGPMVRRGGRTSDVPTARGRAPADPRYLATSPTEDAGARNVRQTGGRAAVVPPPPRATPPPERPAPRPTPKPWDPIDPADEPAPKRAATDDGIVIDFDDDD